MRASSSTSSASKAPSCKGVARLLVEGLALLRPAAWCACGRRPAREIATREPSARSDRSRSPARPCRRPRAPQPGPAVPPVPPAPFQQQGLRVLLGCLARPCRRPRAPQPGSAVARHPPNSRGLARLEISRFSSTRRRPLCCLLVVVASIDLSMPRLFLLIGALHPICRHCTSSDRVHCH